LGGFVCFKNDKVQLEGARYAVQTTKTAVSCGLRMTQLGNKFSPLRGQPDPAL
jgi:hypothetical protein